MNATIRARLLVLALAACQPVGGFESGEDRPTRLGSTSVTVDSIRPIEEEIELFRASLPEHPTTVSGGAASVDELLEAFVAAVNRGDGRRLAELTLTRAEFAYFYYPHTRYTRPPYELSPALVWYRLASRSSRGASRLTTTFESRELQLRGSSCASPEALGDGRLHDCLATVLDADGRWVDVRIFGRILERDGRYKFVSLGNEL